MIRLGLNIDHVATLRNARGEIHPSPTFAAKQAMKFGANSITIHLREDRRHINDRDLFLEETNKNGVMTRPIWQLMYRLPMYKNCQKDCQKNAEFLEERIVNIPSSAII